LSTLRQKPGIIAITEVNYKIKKSFSYAELQLDGYTLYHNELHSNSRGVVVYVDCGLRSRMVCTDILYGEVVIVNIGCHSGSSVTIGNIYTVSQKNRTPVTFSNNSNNPNSISTKFGTKNRQLIGT